VQQLDQNNAIIAQLFNFFTNFSQILQIDVLKKKRSEETPTLQTGCSKVEPKIFSLLQTTFPGAWDGQNLISWNWSLPLPINPVW